jgi:hypothetical protein
MSLRSCSLLLQLGLNSLEIIEYVEGHRIDLIVVGTRGMSKTSLSVNSSNLHVPSERKAGTTNFN